MRHNRVLEGVHMDRVYVGKAVVGAFLAIEKLYYHHPAYMLLEIRINARDGGANAPVGITHFVAKHLGGVSDHRQDGESYKRQLPVQTKHNGDDAGENENVLE